MNSNQFTLDSLNSNRTNSYNLDVNQLDTNEIDFRIMHDDSLPGPVKQMYSTIRDKELYLIKQQKLNTVYINDYQQRDSNIELTNYVNFTWQNILMYNLPSDILLIFKNKLLNLARLISKK